MITDARVRKTARRSRLLIYVAATKKTTRRGSIRGEGRGPSPAPLQRIDAADRLFAATGIEVRHDGIRAYYAEGSDYVQMPPFEPFRDAESYAAMLVHECGHATKHEKRYVRDLGHVRHGDEGYAREELVALS
jgi:antirestriction protein ArdC